MKKNKWKLLTTIFILIMMILLFLSQNIEMDKLIASFIQIISAIFGIGAAFTISMQIQLNAEIKTINQKSTSSSSNEIENKAKMRDGKQYNIQMLTVNYSNKQNASIVEKLSEYEKGYYEKQQENANEILIRTAEKLSNISGQINIPDEDWFMKFLTYTREITDEDFKEIWSDVLINEMKTPNSIKRRALEELSRMSSEEIKLLEKISSHTFNFVDKIGVPIDYLDQDYDVMDFSILQDINVLKSKELTRNIYILPHGEFFLVNNNLTIKFKNNSHEEKNIKIIVYVYTDTGEQIFKSIGLISDDKEYFKFALFLKNQYTDVDISLHNVYNMEDGIINYNPTSLI